MASFFHSSYDINYGLSVCQFSPPVALLVTFNLVSCSLSFYCSILPFPKLISSLVDCSASGITFAYYFEQLEFCRGQCLKASRTELGSGGEIPRVTNKYELFLETVVTAPCKKVFIKTLLPRRQTFPWRAQKIEALIGYVMWRKGVAHRTQD